MKAEPFLIGLRLDRRRALVVGSGPETAFRAEALFRAGAEVTVVSPRPDAAVDALAETGQVRLEKRDFVEHDLDGTWLAVLTDMDSALAQRIADAADSNRVLFCAIDQPRVGSYFHVAVARAGSLAVAISTSGKAPALARRLKQELERVFANANMAGFVDALAERRARTPRADRRRVLTDIVSGVFLRGTFELPET